MTIILFHGLGSSKKLMNYIYDNKYIKNDFIKQLEKIFYNLILYKILYTIIPI